MSQIRRSFVDGLFGQVHIRQAGPTGQRPLVCLHQSPKSSNEFIKILTHLAKDRHVIAIDNPGHGESDLPPSEDDATIESYARSAWAVIDALGLKSVDLLGHHTGAKVATEMVFQRPDDVRKIALISTIILTPDEQKNFSEMFQPIPLDKGGTRFSTLWTRAMEYRGPGVSLEDLARSFAENFRAGEAYEWGHQAAFAYNVHFARRIATLPHPITVLNPADMLYEYTPKVMPHLQNGTLIDLPDWGFGFMDTKPREAAKVILNALD